MQLTHHTDYALRLLMYLAATPDRVVTVGEISAAYRISQNHLVKVAQTLSHLGYINTLRGRSGGLKLARTPAEISVGDVVRRVENNFYLTPCMPPDGQACRINGDCVLQGVLAGAVEAFLTSLDAVPLSSLTTGGPSRLAQPGARELSVG